MTRQQSAVVELARWRALREIDMTPAQRRRLLRSYDEQVNAVADAMKDKSDA